MADHLDEVAHLLATETGIATTAPGRPRRTGSRWSRVSALGRTIGGRVSVEPSTAGLGAGRERVPGLRRAADRPLGRGARLAGAAGAIVASRVPGSQALPAEDQVTMPGSSHATV